MVSLQYKLYILCMMDGHRLELFIIQHLRQPRHQLQPLHHVRYMLQNIQLQQRQFLQKTNIALAEQYLVFTQMQDVLRKSEG